MENGILLTLLGGFSISLGEHEVPEAAFVRRKARSLLKLLALQPEHCLHREQIVDLLWPELDPRSATSQLYKAVHYIRQAFATLQPPCPPEELLRLHDEVLSLTAPGGVHTDVATFQALAHEAARTGNLALLRQAVASYSGDLLPADLYEEWTLECREALRETFLDLLVKLGQGYLAAGYLPEAADALREALGRDPTSEAAHRSLMRVYALEGSHTRALRQYRLCTEVLARELDVEPSPETTRLHRDILERKLQPLPAAADASMQAGPKSPAPPSPLVGRQQELKVIAGLLDQVGQGRGAILTIEGSAGIGKTRLAHEILHIAWLRSYQTLLGSAYEQERQSPYIPFIDALRVALRMEPTHANLIPSELAMAIPELPPTAVPVPSADRLAAQAALFAGVLRFLIVRARTSPLVLIIDDLHAADEGSLKLFHYLARRILDQPILLVGCWRRGELDVVPALEAVIHSLDRDNLLQRLTLTPLSQAEHRDLLAQALKGDVDDMLADEIYRLSEGNPFFAGELVHQGVASEQITQVSKKWRRRGQGTLSISASLRILVNVRLASLSLRAVRLLQMAAIAGREVSLSLLEASLTVDGADTADSLLDLVEEALATGVLEETGLSFRFVHPLFREAVYQQISQARRQALHGQMARALEALHRDDPQMPVEAIAYHYRQMGDVGRAVRYLIQAGDRAQAVYAHNDALHRYEEALSLLAGRIAPDLLRLRAEVEERVGDTYRAVGDVARSLAAYQVALEALTPLSPQERGEVSTLHRKIALVAILAADMPKAAEHLARATEAQGINPIERARMFIAQALFDWHRNALEEAVQHGLRALEIAEASGAEVEASQACEMLALAYMPLGQWEEGLKYELRRRVAGWSPDIVVATDGHLCLWEYHIHGEEPYRRAQEFIEAVAQHAVALGDLRCVGVCHYALGSMAFLRGYPESAARNLTQALELHQRIGSCAGMSYVLARLAGLRTAQGDLQAGWSLVQQGLEVAQRAAARDHCLQRLYAVGISNRMQAADPASAGELVRAAQQLDSEARVCSVCSVQMYPAIAVFYLTSGDLLAAQTYAEKAQHLAETFHNRSGEAYALWVRGEIDAARGEIATAESRLAQATAIFRELGQAYDLAQTLIACCRLPVGDDPELQQRRQACLQEVRGILDRLGLPPI